MPTKVTNIDKPSHTRIKKIIEILDTPELPVNTTDQALTTKTPHTTEFNGIKKVIQSQDRESIPPNESLAIRQTLKRTKFLGLKGMDHTFMTSIWKGG